jgi:hypothetical protein
VGYRLVSRPVKKHLGDRLQQANNCTERALVHGSGSVRSRGLLIYVSDSVAVTGWKACRSWHNKSNAD